MLAWLEFVLVVVVAADSMENPKKEGKTPLQLNCVHCQAQELVTVLVLVMVSQAAAVHSTGQTVVLVLCRVQLMMGERVVDFRSVQGLMVIATS